MIIYQSIRALGAELSPEVLEAIRRELESRASVLRDTHEPEGSTPIAEVADSEAAQAAAALFEASIAEVGLVATCAEARLALSELCSQIGVII